MMSLLFIVDHCQTLLGNLDINGRQMYVQLPTIHLFDENQYIK